MNKSEAISLLKENKNDRGIKNWGKLDFETGGLKSFGIGLTQLRKLAKQIGRDHKLAQQLWKTDNHDAKIIGLLIDEPKKLTREQVEKQVDEVDAGMLSHVFSSCDATLPKASFAFELTQEWIKSKDDLRRRCGYGLVYELSKEKKNGEIRDKFFLHCIKRIDQSIAKEKSMVRGAMAGALIGIGKRSKELNKAAINVAKATGPVDFGSSSCEPTDVLKHLTSDSLKNKLGT